ncbi:MAG: leucine dehydrogenase [Flavobacteriales bacterium]|nr:leucine dehydrogenase [Flavobacteriales bacterium]
MIEVKNLQQAAEKNPVLRKMSEMGHEQVLFCQDNETGLKAIIAIHNTVLGPALGGTRMWKYDNELDALKDVLRLSRGMTYKAAVTGLALGGGKAVIVGDASTEKTEALMRKFGEYVDSLGGKYITAEDVGMSTKDMMYVKMETDHVTGIPVEMGGSGDPSSVTAYGVYMGMKASAKFKWGSDDLNGKRVVVQGIGHVGENLVKHLTEEGATVIINDINEARLQEVSEMYGAEIMMGDAIYDTEMDIYAPCALGATVNDDTLSRLKCSIIAGAANNQLEDEKVHGEAVKSKGMVYAPDFLINAGGLINVYSELHGYDREQALERTRKIYDTTLEILVKAEQEDITTHEAALIMAEHRIANAQA